MARLYFRLVWLIAQILIEAVVAAFAVFCLWAVAKPYAFHTSQPLDHPALIALIALAMLWIAVGPSPYSRSSRSPSEASACTSEDKGARDVP